MNKIFSIFLLLSSGFLYAQTSGLPAPSSTGNSATATGLQSYPTLCTGAQFSQGLSSSSNNCAVPASSGGFTGAVTYTTSHTLTASGVGCASSGGDSGCVVKMNCSAACTITLPNPQPSPIFIVSIQSVGTTVPTVVLGSSMTYNGGSTPPVLISYAFLTVIADTVTTNYIGNTPPIAGRNITLTPSTNGYTLNPFAGVFYASAYGATGNDSTDDTSSINSALTACSAVGGGIVLLTAGTYKINSGAPQLTMVTGCSLLGTHPQVQVIAGAPDGTMTFVGGTILDCSGQASCITGSSLRNASIQSMGFKNWTGKAVLLGGNGVDGDSFSTFQDLMFSGSSSVNGSDQGLVIYNFQHDDFSQIYTFNTNVGVNWINQNNAWSGGNSTCGEIYVHTYPKSAANANTTEPGIWLQTLAPSSGTTYPLLYMDCSKRVQVNSYSGDGTGMNVQVLGQSGAATNGIRLANLDIEGTYFKGVDLNIVTNSFVNIAAVNRVTSNSCTVTTGSCDVYTDSSSTGNTVSSNQPITEYTNPGYSFGLGIRLAIATGFNQSLGCLGDNTAQVVGCRVNGALTVTPTGNGQGSATMIGCAAGYGTTTLSTSGAATTTASNCIPTNAVIDVVVYRITTTITGLTSFTIGDGTTAARFCAAQSTLTSGTVGYCFAATNTTSAIQTAAAAPIVITGNTTATAGVIRIIVYYHTYTAPTF